MVRTGYSLTLEDEGKIGKAFAREIRISPKWAVEFCRELRNKDLAKAIGFLEDVESMRRPLPLKRYKKGVAHRKGLQGAYAGRYPVKAAARIAKVLESARANAEYKGLNAERLYIKHIAAQRGRVIKGFLPRAFGRASAKNEATANIEVILEER